MDNVKAVSFHLSRKENPRRLPPWLACCWCPRGRESLRQGRVLCPCLQKKKLRFEELPKVPLWGGEATKV